MSIPDMMPEEALAEGLTHFKALLEKGESKGELEFRHKNGSIRWWSVDAVKIRETRFIGFTKDITARKQLEEDLKESEKRFSCFMDNLPALVFMKDGNGKIVYVNKAMDVALDASKWMGRTAHEIFSDETAERILSDDKTTTQMGNLKVEENFLDNEGKSRLYETQKFIIPITAKKQFIGGIACDITERRLSEDKIKSLIGEKELILREVHHRIKNNMISIKGLLNLQAETLSDQPAVAVLKDAERRLDSMLVLYDKLYRSSNFEMMSVKDYIPALVDEIVSNFPNSLSVTVEKNIDDFILDTKILQPLGIMINELLTNTMKSAFSGRAGGHIAVSASQRDDRCIVVIADDGVGMPEYITFENSTGFGMRLVSMLAEQIGGTVRIDREYKNGTMFILEFRLNGAICAPA